MGKVHIGKKIKEVWKRSRLKGTEFASLINKDRQVIYDIFNRETIDTGLLEKISQVLEHDFFSHYSHELPVVNDERVGYGKKSELLSSLSDELKAYKKQLADLEKKYELLEKVNKLTEEKLKSIKKESKSK